MLLLLLLHLVIFHLLTARDAPPRKGKDTEYVIRHIDSCPDVGYFFRRDTSPNAIEPGPCYLCFCQADSTAVCWKRDNRRCNVESFHYHGVGKRDTRIRRSPGFSDLFFRDATRDFFNKKEDAECKPFESSFSDDCPPADWCIGCTVCDCDAHGRWDCHILSFCPEKKNKKKSKRKGPIRKVVGKKTLRSTKPTTKTTKKPSTASSAGKHPQKRTKPTNKVKPKLNPMRSSNNKNPPQKRIVKKSVPILRANVTPRPQKYRTSVKYRRVPPTKTDAKKEMIIKKDVVTHNPIDIQASKRNLEMEIAQKVMKKVMANLRKTIDGEMVNITKMANNVAQKNAKAKNVKKGKPNPKQSKPKPKPPKKMNKRQVKKPPKKPLRSRYQIKANDSYRKQTQKNPPTKPPRKPNKKPAKKATRKPPPNYVRNKRDLILEGDLKSLSVIGPGNSTDPPSTTTISYYVVPVTSNISSILPPVENNCSRKLVESTTVPQNNKYYSYFVHVEDPKVERNRSVRNEDSTQVNVTETILNLIGTDMVPSKNIKKSAERIYYGDRQFTALAELNPEANELKYSKWSHLKLFKEKKINYVSEKHRGLVKLISPANKTVTEDYKNKVHGKDIERKFNSRKFNLVKLLNRSRYNKPINKMKTENTTNITPPNKKAGDLQNLLSKLLGEFYKNATFNSNTSKKSRKFSVIKYLKKIFNKLFRRKKSAERFSRHHIIETLCDNFGPCKVSVKDKALLKAKLIELDAETSKILRTVKIIKGLLKLIALPKSLDSDLSKHESMHNDLQKLNNILKGNYPNDGSSPMTSTQVTQIDYIKKNTQDFVQSVNKFASLLNEIITILTKHEANKKDTSNRTLRYSHNDNKILKDEDPFQSLKHLFVRYNLVQNSFMKRMYEQLNNFEKVNKNSKVSEVKDLNNTVEIENFSRNIIQNLRKLKRLAQTLSFSGRTKRDTMKDDDAIEYLLMLMEYLLKQNHPLDAAPVNDGIDLLIEAIKNAPDIKPIKKKVLEYTPAPYGDITTISYVPATNTDSPLSDDESHSDNADNDKTSSEDSGRLKLEDTEDTLRTKIEENKELAEMVAEEERDPDDKYQYNRKIAIDKAEEYTETPFYNRAEDNVILEADNAIETTTMPSIDFEMSEKIYKDDGLENLNIDTQANVENNNIDKQIIDSGVDDKKFEVFTGDMDEESILPGTILTSVSDHPSTVTTEYATPVKKTRTKMRHLNLESVDSESIDKKSKLEWIEENFGREREKDRDFTDLDDFNITTPVSVTSKALSTATTEKADLSVLTKEVVDDSEKRRKAKMNAEDVMFRKQMDLLNSLDYGTEKGEFDESESKDGNIEERYSSDTFQSYFR